MIRPVDINLNIQHAPDMARLALTEQQTRPELAAQQFADRLEKQARQQQEQIQKQDATDKANVNPDQKGQNAYAKRKPVKKKAEEKKKTPPRRTEGESMFNILV